MPVNSFDETHAVDYLDKERVELAKLRSQKIGSSVLTPRFILPLEDSVNLSDTLPAPTSNTPGTFDVVNNTSKLVAYLPMDLDVEDASNSNDGTVTGTETYVDGPLFAVTPSGGIKQRKAFDFDGSSYITLANESNFDFEHTNTFSISFWIYRTVTATDGVVCKGNDFIIAGGVDPGWYVFIGTAINFRLIDSLSNTFTATSPSTPLNQWYHIVCTFSGNSNQSGLKIYQDSVLVATGTSSAISNSILNNRSVVIGAESDGSSVLTGQLDDVQIWNVELSSSEVTDLYAGKQINKDTGATNPAMLGMSDVA